MGAFSKGKRSLAISDRSGQQFRYSEMVREWNGSWVHFSEYEAKHPQLTPRPKGGDPQALQYARPDVRRGTGVDVNLDLYYWPGQYLNSGNGMLPGISGDVINYQRQANTAVGDVTIVVS